MWQGKQIPYAVFRIRIQLNPDPDMGPAKNINLDPSYFLTLSEKKLKLPVPVLHNYMIFSLKEVN